MQRGWLGRHCGKRASDRAEKEGPGGGRIEAGRRLPTSREAEVSTGPGDREAILDVRYSCPAGRARASGHAAGFGEPTAEMEAVRGEERASPLGEPGHADAGVQESRGESKPAGLPGLLGKRDGNGWTWMLRGSVMVGRRDLKPAGSVVLGGGSRGGGYRYVAV